MLPPPQSGYRRRHQRAIQKLHQPARLTANRWESLTGIVVRGLTARSVPGRRTRWRTLDRFTFPYPSEDSSAKNPDQPNEDQVNSHDVVQNARHNQDQDSRNQCNERSGHGVMNRHSSTTGLRQQRQRDDQHQRPKQSKSSVEHSAPPLRKSTHSLPADACDLSSRIGETAHLSPCGPAGCERKEKEDSPHWTVGRQLGSYRLLAWTSPLYSLP